MELTRLLRLLWDRRGWMLFGLFIALLASVLSAYRIAASPLRLEPRSTSYGAANTQVFVDSRRSTIATLAGNSQPLASRSNLLAQFLASSEVRAEIAQRMGMPKESIPVISSPNTVQQLQSVNLSVANQIAGQGTTSGYAISFQPQLELPLIDIYTRAPTARRARELADIAASALSHHVDSLSDSSGVPRDSPARIVLREIGPATGGQVTNQVRTIALLVAFLGTFLVWCAAILFFTWLRADWKRTGLLPDPTLQHPAD
jgi:hypothetical protein